MLLLSALHAQVAAAATLTVDNSANPVAGSWPTLKSALSLATNGDTILVRPGVYAGVNNTQIALSSSRAVYIRSTGGSSVTVIDCQNAAWAFRFTGADNLRTAVMGLQGLTIKRCQGLQGGAMYIDSVRVVIDQCILQDCRAIGQQFGKDGMGGAMFMQDSHSQMTNSVILRNHASFGGGTFAFGADATTFENVTWQENSSDEFGGAFVPEEQSATVLRNCKFVSNRSPFGGGIDTGGTSTTTIINTLFFNNTAQRGAAVYFYGNTHDTFTNCTFLKNFGSNSGGAFESGTNTAPVFNQCLFEQNFAVGQGGVGRTGGSTIVTFTKSQFLRNSSPRGAVLTLEGDSLIRLNGCFGSHNIASGAGAILESQSFGVVVDHGSVWQSNYAFEGGVIAQSGDKSWQFYDTVFYNNSAVLGGAIFVENVAAVSCNGCIFRANRASDGGAVAVTFTSQFQATNSTFIANYATRTAGALYSTSSSSFNVTRSTFVNNVAEQAGGAIAISGAATVTNSVFMNNQASGLLGVGGAIYTAQIASSYCNATLFQGLSFGGNTAAVGGGGIYTTWEYYGSALVTSTGQIAFCFPKCKHCSDLGNAAPYGSLIASPVFAVKIERAPPARIISFVAFNASVLALDYYGSLVTAQSGSRAVLQLDPASAGSCALADPPVAGFSEGVAVFSALVVGAAPNAQCRFIFSAIPQITGIPLSARASVTSIRCPAGYSASGTGTKSRCTPCGAGFYNINGDGTCRSCPNHALCTGGSSIQVSGGFWPAIVNGTVQTLVCPNHFCCSDEWCPLNSPCAVNRHGLLCGTCDGDLVDVSGECVPCPGTDVPLFVMLFVGVIVVLSVSLLLQRQAGNPVFSQATFFMQVAGLVVPITELKAFAVGFGGILGLNLPAFITAASSLRGTTRCLLRWTPLGKTLASYVLPLIMVVVLVLMALLHLLFNRALLAWRLRRIQQDIEGSSRNITNPLNRQASVGTMITNASVAAVRAAPVFPWERYTTTMFRIVLVSYSVVTDTTLQLVLCGDVLGELVMVTQPSVLCYESDHLLWAIFAWFLVVLWVIGLPLAMWGFLYRQRQRGDLYHESVRDQIGVLYDDYKPQRYWFGSFIFIRRSIAVVAYTLLFAASVERQLALYACLMLFLLVQLHLNPYMQQEFNIADVYLIVILLCLNSIQLAKFGLLSINPDLANSSTSYLAILQLILVSFVIAWVCLQFLFVVYRTVKRAWAIFRGSQLRMMATPKPSEASSSVELVQRGGDL